MSSRNVVDLRNRPRRLKAARPPAPTRALSPTSRTSPLRDKRRRIRMFALGIFAVFMIAGVFAASWASYLPRYTINTVTVEGAKTVPKSLITHYVDTQLTTSTRPFLAHNSIFLFDTSALARNIVGFFPRIKSASVSRESLLATAIAVTVQERQEFALWCIPPAPADYSTSCYSMDDIGFIFAPAPKSDFGIASSSAQKYIFSGGFATTTDPIGNMFAPGHLPGIIALFDQLSQFGLTPTGSAIDDNGSDFTTHLKQGFDIKASFGQDPDSLVRDLGLILGSDVLKGRQSDILYIDLRFGDRTYYKLKGADDTATQ